MKYFKLNNFLALFASGVLLFGISSCKKAEKFDALGDAGQKIMTIIDGGPEGFGNSSLSFDNSKPIDSIQVRLSYTGPAVLDHDVTVTMVTDVAALTKYNAGVPAGGLKFTLLPTSLYTYRTNKVVVKAGDSQSQPFWVIFYPDQLDLAVSYMLPLAISSIDGASDIAKAPGTGVRFLHIIGNPLAGNYDVQGYFYHPASPRPFTRTGASGFLTPVSDKALVTELGDLGGSGYYAVLTVPDPFATTVQAVTISVYPGSISPVYQWDAGLPTTGTPTYTPQPLPDWGKSGQCNNTYNPTTKTFYLRYGYLGGTGWRVTEEILKKV